MIQIRTTVLPLLLARLSFTGSLHAAEPEAPGADNMGEIAKKLNNPAASLISLPFQSNFDYGGGPNDDGFQYKLNFQPVIPFRLNDRWKIISRTIIPWIYQSDRIGYGTQDGLGDSTITLWLS